MMLMVMMMMMADDADDDGDDDDAVPQSSPTLPRLASVGGMLLPCSVRAPSELSAQPEAVPSRSRFRPSSPELPVPSCLSSLAAYSGASQVWVTSAPLPRKWRRHKRTHTRSVNVKRGISERAVFTESNLEPKHCG